MTPLSSITTEGVCERMRLMEGLDQSMLTAYTSTIRKANVNGRVLSQCSIDELKKEMNMNFGDWQLFRAMVLDMRSLENQILQEEAAGEPGPGETAKRAAAPGGTDASPMFSFNLSFEELSTVGLDEPVRPGPAQWTGGAHRTTSMNSLNSQESSNDICRLTERQQAEYRCAYQEYIAQMSLLETGCSTERPVLPQPAHFMTAPSEDRSKEATEQDGRKSFGKKGKAAAEGGELASNPEVLDPITEEDEKGEPGSSKTPADRGGAHLKPKPAAGLRYQKLASDDESEESDLPLLRRGLDSKPACGSLALKGKDYLSDATLDKKDSSDSGVRSNESSPNHSLQDEEAELSQLARAHPSSLGGLQDSAVARMSICSEDQCSLLTSSPEESWPSSRSGNLNRTPSSVTLNNNSNRALTAGSASQPGPNNENVRVVHLKRGLKPGDPPEICQVSSDTLTFGEERESIL